MISYHGNINLRKRKLDKQGGVKMFNRNKFRAKIIEQNLTNEEVATHLNISATTLYRKMNGSSDFTRNEIQLLKDLLKLSVKEANDIFFS